MSTRIFDTARKRVYDRFPEVPKELKDAALEAAPGFLASLKETNLRRRSLGREGLTLEQLEKMPLEQLLEIMPKAAGLAAGAKDATVEPLVKMVVSASAEIKTAAQEVKAQAARKDLARIAFERLKKAALRN